MSADKVKEGILNNHKPYGKNWEDFLLPDQIAFLHKAMDEYAKNKSINFWKFCIKNNYRLTLASDEIYSLFIQSKQ